MSQKRTQLSSCAKVRYRAGVTILAVLLSVLAGCAVGEKGASRSAAQKTAVTKPSTAPQGPTVARLKDGREGFIITERPHLKGQTRADFRHAIAMMKGKDYDGAIALLKKVIAQSPGVTAPYIDIALAYEHIGKVAKAEKNLKTALSLVPDHPVASNEYALLLRKTGHFAEARTVYEKSLKAFPEYLPAHRNLGILCDLYLNDPKCALEQYEIYSKSKPADKQIKIWIADLRMRMGRK
jgi:tetratricopeptide (TPR) repeat protein